MPELWFGLELYLEAFFKIDTSRQVGFGPSRLDWFKIEEFCDRQQLYGEQREIMHHHIEAMDRAFLKWSKSKDGNKPGTNANKG